MVLVVIGQVIWCVAQHWPLRAWARRWAAALVLGIAPYALLARTMADQQQARRFHASFPIDAVRQLLGGRWFGAAALAVLIVVAGAAALRAWPPRAVSAGGIVVVAFLWLVARQARD